MDPGPRRKRHRAWAANVALVPMAVTTLLVYVWTVVWSARISVSSSKMVPRFDWVGLAQYQRLFSTERWTISIQHAAIFGVLFILAALVVGFLLAVFIDQRVRGEDVLRTVFLYPYAMSFIATGLVWQWMLNPALGLQAALRSLGWSGVTIDWIVRQDRVLYTIVLAAVWQASGLVMAVLLATLRGLDPEQWSAARIEGIPRWRYYLHIVLPQLAPAFATCFVLLAVAVVRLYDIVVAMTMGGPGDASEVPAKFIMDNLFLRANIGLASAASIVMLATVMAVVSPWLYVQRVRALRAAQGTT
jgi:glucose/mannose transport system permease protein